MIRFLAPTLRATAFTLALFVLAVNIRKGAPVLHFVGTVFLGMIGPSGTWAIIKRYPETDLLAWASLTITSSIIAIMALLRLVALLWA